MSKKQFWLVKTEPTSFSIQDLAKCPKQTTCWDGVRNYQARNFMRAMHVGDDVLFYHSSADPPAVVGSARVVREAYPDTTAQNPKDHHYDPKASPENPIWEMVDLKLVEIFSEPLALERLRDVAALKKMELLKRGSRLSVQVVTPSEFETILRMARGKTRKA
ncbi:MAG TPA: EVE domain-containing protein [Pirellulales bacterium]|nr:EVE domain-containing protein [Pirellulales bacterium]